MLGLDVKASLTFVSGVAISSHSLLHALSDDTCQRRSHRPLPSTPACVTLQQQSGGSHLAAKLNLIENTE